jgi:hypothetical protein
MRPMAINLILLRCFSDQAQWAKGALGSRRMTDHQGAVFSAKKRSKKVIVTFGFESAFAESWPLADQFRACINALIHGTFL